MLQDNCDPGLGPRVLPQSPETVRNKFARLITERLLARDDLNAIIDESEATGQTVDELLMAKGVAKHEMLRCLSDYYGLPYLEYDEGLIANADVLSMVDLQKLKQRLWFPLSIHGEQARVIICDPNDRSLCEDIRTALRVTALQVILALPTDVRRIIENHQDLNPDFPPSAGRTPLARLRTWLADHRTQLAQYRTSLAKGRTGLALVRTGVSFISIGLVMFRIFGIGYLVILETALVAVGLVMTADGILWYIPARKIGQTCPYYPVTEPTFGTTLLELKPDGERPDFVRTPPVDGAEQLRTRWNRLTPIMKRRFFAIDRTDLADERTILANYRTVMARARTGLAFTRTGMAFVGLGIALLRQFAAGPWTILDGALILAGVIMFLEGFHWYVPGRQAGRECHEALKRATKARSIWDFMFRPFDKDISLDDLPPLLAIEGSHAPGIWGTTGLALERTLIAERRNVKSRLRTIMARSRTGMALIRTGTSLFSVGMGLLVYFGTTNILWAIFNVTLGTLGLLLVADGFFWHIPAERAKKQFPYCFGDMEIVLPDYGKPSPDWKKLVFSHEDL
jgi:uncharacterized membrane protein YidH (DUF202 family)